MILFTVVTISAWITHSESLKFTRYQYHLRNCRQLLNTVTLVLTWRNRNSHRNTRSRADRWAFLFCCITHTKFIDFSVSLILKDMRYTVTIFFMDNSGKVWLIRTSTFYHTHTHTHTRTHDFVLLCINYYSALNGKLWLPCAVSLKFNCNMRDIEHARVVSSDASHHAEQTLRSLLCEACHTSIYSIKSQGWQVYFWTFKAVTHTEE